MYCKEWHVPYIYASGSPVGCFQQHPPKHMSNLLPYDLMAATMCLGNRNFQLHCKLWGLLYICDPYWQTGQCWPTLFPPSLQVLVGSSLAEPKGKPEDKGLGLGQTSGGDRKLDIISLTWDKPFAGHPCGVCTGSGGLTAGRSGGSPENSEGGWLVCGNCFFPGITMWSSCFQSV